jgi:hypothetical protein
MFGGTLVVARTFSNAAGPSPAQCHPRAFCASVSECFLVSAIAPCVVVYVEV